MRFGGFDNNTSTIPSHLKSNHLVIANLHNQSHWALVTGIDIKTETLNINDPLKNVTTDKVTSIRTFGWYERLKGENEEEWKV